MPDAYTERALRFVAIEDELDQLEERKKALTEERKDLEAELLEDFTDAGRQKDTLGGRTIYLRRNVFASVKADDEGFKDSAYAAMRAHGLGDMVKESVNGNTLKSYVTREMERAREAGEEFSLPKDLAPHIKITTEWRVLATAKKES